MLKSGNLAQPMADSPHSRNVETRKEYDLEIFRLENFMSTSQAFLSLKIFQSGKIVVSVGGKFKYFFSDIYI